MGETTTNVVVKFKPMIRRIAARLATKLPAGILIDDLMQEGMVALILAVRQCKDRDEHFTAYAYQRVQGAMLDSLREMDNAPRHLRRQARLANNVIDRLEQKLGRRPFESEIAAEIGMRLSAYQRLLFDVYSSHLLYFDPTEAGYSEVFSVIDDGDTPEGIMAHRQLIDAIDGAIHGLPEPLHRVVVAIYREGIGAQELAGRLALSEPRISQLRKESLECIRGELRTRGLMPD